MKVLKSLLLGLAALTTYTTADACSRVVYLGDKGYVMVGRTLDWKTPIPTNIYVYPQGISKVSAPSGPRFEWTAKYGSVVAVSYDGGVTEGMNELGLTVNGLFCKTAVYPTAPQGSDVPVMSLAMFVPYFLDNFATVDEVDTWLQNNKFGIFGATFDGGTVSALHWAMTDATGETLMLEFVGGEVKTYRGRDLTVLTNDPEHPAMMAIEKYWEGVNGVNMLPGTVRSADRFVRASFFINHVPKDLDYPQALGSLSSIMGNVAVPYGYEIQGEPNVSSTQWRSISDATGGKYYFRFADNYSDFWVDLCRLRLNVGAPILKLDTTNHLDFSGCINGRMKESKGFTPMY